MTSSNLINASGKILINKNIDNVFAFFANPTNDHLWRTEINESKLDGTLQSGVTVSEYSYLSKRASNNLLEMKCVQFDKNSIAIFETSNNAKFYLKSQRVAKAVSGDATELTYRLDFDKSIVKFALGFSLPKFIISLKAGSDMKKYLRQLKDHLESA
jgi:hypothetical protein